MKNDITTISARIVLRIGENVLAADEIVGLTLKQVYQRNEMLSYDTRKGITAEDNDDEQLTAIIRAANAENAFHAIVGYKVLPSNNLTTFTIGSFCGIFHEK